MIPVLFRLGPITLYSYGLMMPLGFRTADLIAPREFRRKGYHPENASVLVVWTAIAAIVGSRIYDVIDHWDAYRLDPWSMIASGSGFVYFGGFFLAVFVSWLVARYYKIPWLTLADMAAPALLL